MLKQQSPGKFTKEKIAILVLWFAVLIGIRALIGLVLHDVWAGTMGAVAVTFVIFYASLRYTRLQKYRQVINSALMLWYRKKFFYISGIISMVLLGSILGFIEYGNAYYSDRLITVEFTGSELGDSLELLSANEQMQSNLAENLKKYSAIEIVAITLASADKSLNGYYSKAVSFMFAEDIEIMIFMLLFRTRREIFAAPPAKAQSLT